MSEWQPIETCPKTTSVLLYGGEVHEGYWTQVDYNEFRGVYIYGWDFGVAEIDPTNFYPTHWMPIPDAPKGE